MTVMTDMVYGRGQRTIVKGFVYDKVICLLKIVHLYQLLRLKNAMFFLLRMSTGACQPQ